MNDQQLLETLVSKEVMYHGVIVDLEHWDVTLPNGHHALREVCTHPGASAVVALDAEGNLIMVRQMRIAVGRLTTEIPAGKLDGPGEDPLDCARRELSEETGLEADRWEELTCVETTPGFTNERIHLYLATSLRQGTAHPDADEFVGLIRLPLAEAVARVMDGTFRDGKTCLGIMMAAAKLASST